MAQLIFDLGRGAKFGRADFFVSASNVAAARWIDHWPAWRASTLLLHGPPGCGKTHLAHLWCARAPATLVPGAILDEARLRQLLDRGERRIAVDDADCAGEAVLLHLINVCREDGGGVLLTAGVAPASWRTTLADFGSRLRAAPSVGIELPDDALLDAVLAKHFADRQVLVAPEVIAYLSRHMNRSLAEAAAVAAALDAAALRAGGAITVPLARRLLAERAGQQSPSESDPTVT
ncbi:MAG TPA: DNA replication protein [Stellaceae bacterium]|jgi:chromosomal replication initiation ATPase DnaA